MTNKLYYSNPIHAAYMAQEFGVMFRVRESQNVKRGVPAKHSTVKRWVDVSNPFSVASDHYKNKRLWVHPDGLDIFEPREGDMVRVPVIDSETKEFLHHDVGMCGGSGDIVKEWGDDIGWSILDIDAIIQRDNKPFIMPEIEND